MRGRQPIALVCFCLELSMLVDSVHFFITSHDPRFASDWKAANLRIRAHSQDDGDMGGRIGWMKTGVWVQ